MTLAPLLGAPIAIQIHALAAIAAFALGLLQLALPKGTFPHRTMGWIWVLLMLIVVLSSFLIHQIRVWGLWSPIHLLSIFTLVTLPLGVRHARKGCQPSMGNAQFVRRRSGHRGRFHIRPRSYHARSGLWPWALKSRRRGEGPPKRGLRFQPRIRAITD